MGTQGKITTHRVVALPTAGMSAGLTCIVCAAHVHVYRSRSGTLWMRHNQSHDEQRCAAFASGPEGYEHSLLKYWVRDRLRVNGYDAECERQDGTGFTSFLPPVSKDSGLAALRAGFRFRCGSDIDARWDEQVDQRCISEQFGERVELTQQHVRM